MGSKKVEHHLGKNCSTTCSFDLRGRSLHCTCSFSSLRLRDTQWLIPVGISSESLDHITNLDLVFLIFGKTSADNLVTLEDL